MKKKFFAGTLTAWVVGALMLSGCGNDVERLGDEQTQNNGDVTTDLMDEHLELTWMTILHTASPPTDEVVSLIEEATNTSIDFQWVPDASRNERMTTALASQELADIVTFTDLQNTSVRNALESGLFWDLTDYLDAFPNLSQISQERRITASIEGRLYGVPLERWASRRGFTMRQDWLDNLGLDVPTTMDELFEVARAFTEDDPDGNGIDDTVGFVGRSEFLAMSFVNTLTYMGGPNRWRVEADGSFTHAYETEAWIDNMNWWREIVDNGFIQADFLVTATADQDQLFAQGRGGMYPNLTNIGSLRNLAEGLQGDDFALVPVNRISNGDGMYRVIAENNGVGGIFAIPKSQVETEAALMRILQFIDQLFEEEIRMLIGHGIEGVHYEFDESGALVIIDTEKWQQDVQPLGQNVASVTRFVVQQSHPEMVLRDELILDNETIAVFNPAMGLNSETFNERGASLDQMMDDVTLQYIMGAVDLDDYLSALEDWRNQGGRQMAEEYAESYARMLSQ